MARPGRQDRARASGIGGQVCAGFAVLLILVALLGWSDRRSLDAIGTAQAALDSAAAASSEAAALRQRLAAAEEAGEQLRQAATPARLLSWRAAMTAAEQAAAGSATLAAALRAERDATEAVADADMTQQLLLQRVQDRAIVLSNMLQALSEAGSGAAAARRADHTLGVLLLAATRVQPGTESTEQARLGREVARLAELATDPPAHGLLKPAQRLFGQFDAALGALTEAEQRAAAPRLRLASATEDLRRQTADLGHDLAARRDAAAAVLAQDIGRARLLSAALVVTALLLGALLAWLIAGAIARPIARLAAALRALAAGGSNPPLPDLGRPDVFGGMARALETLDRDAAARRQSAAEQTATEGRLRAEHAAALAAAAEERERLRQELAQAVATGAEHQAASERWARNAEEAGRLAQAADAVLAGAAPHVQGAAAAAGQLAAAVAETTRHVDRAAAVAGQMAGQVRNSEATAQGLADAVQRISAVVATIGAVARQTRMLALNATIEAARAGAAGAGFAVVAEEVKGLAGQTATAASQISAQVAAIQDTSGAVATAMRGLGTGLAAMHASCGAAVTTLGEQATAAREVAGRVERIERGLGGPPANRPGANLEAFQLLPVSRQSGG